MTVAIPARRPHRLRTGTAVVALLGAFVVGVPAAGAATDVVVGNTVPGDPPPAANTGYGASGDGTIEQTFTAPAGVTALRDVRVFINVNFYDGGEASLVRLGADGAPTGAELGTVAVPQFSPDPAALERRFVLSPPVLARPGERFAIRLRAASNLLIAPYVEIGPDDYPDGVVRSGPAPYVEYSNVDARFNATFTAPSTDGALRGLSLTSGRLSPAFDPAVSDYAASVPSGTASIGVTPTSADAGATLTVAGRPATSGRPTTVPLAIGANPIEVRSVAEDGETVRSYAVTVTRAAPTAVVPAPAPSGPPATSPAPPAPTVTFGTATVSRRSGTVSVPVTTNAPGRLSGVATHDRRRRAGSRVSSSSKPGPGRFTYARTRPRRTSGRTFVVRMTRTAAGRRVRFGGRRVTLRLTSLLRADSGLLVRRTANVRARLR